MMMICVLLSIERISLQEISGSSTSMMEEKTMDIKYIYARHGSRPCPLSIAEAKQLKGDSDELWDRVASQSGAVAGDDGGESVLCMPLCAGFFLYSRMWILSQVGLKKPKVLWRTYLLRRLQKPFIQFPFECWIRRKLKVIN